jgi:hypothetical protein
MSIQQEPRSNRGEVLDLHRLSFWAQASAWAGCVSITDPSHFRSPLSSEYGSYFRGAYTGRGIISGLVSWQAFILIAQEIRIPLFLYWVE